MSAPESTLENGGATRNDTIVGVLRDEILRGQYRAGERLPSERDLAARFATGRGSVREALKKLEQLGIATIQRGGARVVPIEHCTLDVLGPLLDLEQIPDPLLVDQVFEIFGALLGIAARDALRKSGDAEWLRFEHIVASIEHASADQAERHDAFRQLAEFCIEVANHLVLRLIMNGLRTTFLARMQRSGIRAELAGPDYDAVVADLRRAALERDVDQVCRSLARVNRFFRDRIRQALTERNARKGA